MNNLTERLLAKLTLGSILVVGGCATQPPSDQRLNAKSPILRYAAEDMEYTTVSTDQIPSAVHVFGKPATQNVHPRVSTDTPITDHPVTALAGFACLNSPCFEPGDVTQTSPLNSIYSARWTAERENNPKLLALAESAHHAIDLLASKELSQRQKAVLEHETGALLDRTRSLYHSTYAFQTIPSANQPIALQIENSISRIVERDASYINEQSWIEENRKGKPPLIDLSKEAAQMEYFNAAVLPKIVGTANAATNPDLAAIQKAYVQGHAVIKTTVDLTEIQANQLFNLSENMGANCGHSLVGWWNNQKPPEDVLKKQEHEHSVRDAKFCFLGKIDDLTMANESASLGLPTERAKNKPIDPPKDRATIEKLVRTAQEILQNPNGVAGISKKLEL